MPSDALLLFDSLENAQVYKAILNEVTEVAAKQLQASSKAQMTLFRREIAIHKCCRSVSSSPTEVCSSLLSKHRLKKSRQKLVLTLSICWLCCRRMWFNFWVHVSSQIV